MKACDSESSIHVSTLPKEERKPYEEDNCTGKPLSKIWTKERARYSQRRLLELREQIPFSVGDG